MSLDLTILDKGLARFLENDLILIYHAGVTIEEFENAAHVLLSILPVLGGNLNFLRTKIKPSKKVDNLSELWQGTELDLHVEDVVKTPWINDVVKSVELSHLKNFLDAKFNVIKLLRQCVVTIQTVALIDGSILRFKVQGPFGDVNAMLHIARAYCSILDGYLPTMVSSFRPPLKLKESLIEKALEQSKYVNDIPIARMHAESFRTGWFPFLRRGLSSVMHKLRNKARHTSPRVNMALHIPQAAINAWSNEAENRNIQVTEHDLVLAFLYQQASIDPADPSTVSIAVNIQRHLETEAAFGNPWLRIPVPSRQFNGLRSQNDTTALVDRAVHIRHTIDSAREPLCLHQIMEQHSSMKNSPFVIRRFASKSTQLVVSSWAKQPFFDINIQGGKPVLVDASVSFYGALRRLGFVVDDLLIMWKGDRHEDGYWVQGHLSTGLWERMTDTLADYF
ncbi:uncharacterized protein N7443_007872 [Penicillium atrosanguineum]|uniref:Uncharacterized protein n=1 Tax=Penicillium atrosanguineum TaxID=1132637 RepID=A0A9W9PPA0_9EURO|nr:uncharacterized protein N7443_007872 [Penicillium atrosanguineum]KAJ5118943.1 hypothetical protein N7526_010580 [Penicillium atrosanguineum]KAJ5296979.1 hypothetical protein N7443_007872 [Penicillium atrosanguineum]KAJ5299739.1 hypothetical protein N7476_011296 [Penicillium atrosanguineum]